MVTRTDVLRTGVTKSNQKRGFVPCLGSLKLKVTMTRSLFLQGCGGVSFLRWRCFGTKQVMPTPYTQLEMKMPSKVEKVFETISVLLLFSLISLEKIIAMMSPQVPNGLPNAYGKIGSETNWHIERIRRSDITLYREDIYIYINQIL